MPPSDVYPEPLTRSPVFDAWRRQWLEIARRSGAQLSMEASEIKAFAAQCDGAQVIVGDDAFDFFAGFQSVTRGTGESGRAITPRLDWSVIPSLRTFDSATPAWIEIAAPRQGLRFCEPIRTFGALTYEVELDQVPLEDVARQAARENFAGCKRVVVQHQFLEPSATARLQYLGLYLVGRRDDSGELLRGRHNRDFVRRPNGVVTLLGEEREEETSFVQRHHQGLSDEIAFHVLGVNALVHCRNVRVDDVEPSEKLSGVHRKKFANKTDARGLEKFRRVNLSAFRRELEEQARARGETDFSLHFVIPHFAHYGGVDPVTGRERGLLFGKHKAVVFRPHSMRGNPERGTVTKEYQVGDATEEVISAGLERLRQTDQQHRTDLGRSSDI